SGAINVFVVVKSFIFGLSFSMVTPTFNLPRSILGPKCDISLHISFFLSLISTYPTPNTTILPGGNTIRFPALRAWGNYIVLFVRHNISYALIVYIVFVCFIFYSMESFIYDIIL